MPKIDVSAHDLERLDELMAEDLIRDWWEYLASLRGRVLEAMPKAKQSRAIAQLIQERDAAKESERRMLELWNQTRRELDAERLKKRPITRIVSRTDPPIFPETPQ